MGRGALGAGKGICSFERSGDGSTSATLGGADAFGLRVLSETFAILAGCLMRRVVELPVSLRALVICCAALPLLAGTARADDIVIGSPRLKSVGLDTLRLPCSATVGEGSSSKLGRGTAGAEGSSLYLKSFKKPLFFDLTVFAGAAAAGITGSGDVGGG